MNPILAHTLITDPERSPEQWLIVLHGIFGAGRNWGMVANRLVQARPDWGAVLVDLRMHGDSQGFPPPHTLKAAAADVGQLVQSLRIPAAATLGHSRAHRRPWEIHFMRATESEALDDTAVARLTATGSRNRRVFLHRVEGGHWLNADNPDAVVRLLSAGLP